MALAALALSSVGSSSGCGSVRRKGTDSTGGTSGTGGTGGSDASVPLDAAGGDLIMRDAPASDGSAGDGSAGDGNAGDGRKADASADGATTDAKPGDGGGTDLRPAGDAGACVAAPEQCNGKDDDCDGVVDDGCPIDQSILGTTAGAAQGPVFGSLTQAGISPFAQPCPDGQQIIALTGNAGSAIDAVGVKCGTLRVREDRTTTPFGYSVVVEAGDAFPAQGGTGGIAQGIDAALGCHVNEVAVSIQGWMIDATGTCPADYCPSGVKTNCTTLTGLTITCASYTISGAPGSFALHLGTPRTNPIVGTGDATGRKSASFACTAPGALHRLDGVKGPFLSSCTSTVVQGLRATCTTPTLTVR